MMRDHFTTARTEDWDTRLARYWAFQEKKKVDEEKYGRYRLMQTSEFYHGEPDGSNLDTGRAQGELSRLLDSDLNRPHDAGAGAIAYKLRSAVAMHRRARVGTEFHGFLQLPPEIRHIIYGFVLLKGIVIVPNNTRAIGPGTVKYWQSNDGECYLRYDGLVKDLKRMGRRQRRPLFLIQGVHRTVHAEALQVYFGGNKFIFPSGMFFRPSLFGTLVRIASSDVEVMERRYSRKFENGENNAPLVRDVSYAFDMRDCVTDDYENLYRDPTLKNNIDGQSVSPRGALQMLHDRKALELEIVWAERVDCIKWMTLDRLGLSFDECYCSIGCCRKVGWVLDRILYAGPPPGTEDTRENAYSILDWKARPPLVISVSGWKNDMEGKLIREKLGKLRESLESIEIRFRPDTDRQELVTDDRFLR